MACGCKRRADKMKKLIRRVVKLDGKTVVQEVPNPDYVEMEKE